jgi:hypothetical protein
MLIATSSFRVLRRPFESVQLSDIEARLAQFERWVSAGSVLSFVLALSSYGILEAL